jgi:microcystin-dependent protein
MPITSSASGVKAGTVAFFAANSTPPGWLKANGATISRAAYAALFAAIGTTYGAGDGSTTFALPDCRGEFLRGLDDGRGVDAGRGIGTSQADQIKSHSHAYSLGVTGGSGAPTPNASGTAQTQATGGNETRPRNVAMLACIKF